MGSTMGQALPQNNVEKLPYQISLSDLNRTLVINIGIDKETMEQKSRNRSIHI